MTDDAPSRARRPFLTAEWRHLVMLSYEVDLDVLVPLVPAGLALDLWHGRALVSVVGSRSLHPRVPGAPIPWHRDFAQHHWGYTRQRDGGTAEYEVVHRPWRVWTAGGATLTMDVARLYGPAFAPALARAPGSALVAEGSSVIVYAPRRLVTTETRRMSLR